MSVSFANFSNSLTHLQGGPKNGLFLEVCNSHICWHRIAFSISNCSVFIQIKNGVLHITIFKYSLRSFNTRVTNSPVFYGPPCRCRMCYYSEMMHYASWAIGKLEMHVLSQRCVGELIRHIVMAHPVDVECVRQRGTDRRCPSAAG